MIEHPAVHEDENFSPKEIECGNADEFLRCFDPMGGLFREGKWFFRGVCDSTYELIPSVFRPEEQESVAQVLGFGSAVLKYEEHLRNFHAYHILREAQTLVNFIHRVDDAGIAFPGAMMDVVLSIDRITKKVVGLLTGIDKSRKAGNDYRPVYLPMDDDFWPPPSIFQTIALARHAGIPTRLLDLTSSPHIAAYFACEKVTRQDISSSQRVCVWAIAENLTKQRASESQQFHFLDLLRVPKERNLNMVAQRGIFALSYIPNRDWHHEADTASIDQSIARCVKHIPSLHALASEVYESFIKVTLPAGESFEVLSCLDRLGIGRATLFPELGEIVNSFREQWAWKSTLGKS